MTECPAPDAPIQPVSRHARSLSDPTSLESHYTSLAEVLCNSRREFYSSLSLDSVTSSSDFEWDDEMSVGLEIADIQAGTSIQARGTPLPLPERDPLECNICLEETTTAFRCAVGCVACAECMSTYIDNRLSEHEVVETKCMGYQCLEVLSDHTLSTYASPGTWRKFQKLRRLKLDPNLTECPHCEVEHDSQACCSLYVQGCHPRQS